MVMVKENGKYLVKDADGKTVRGKHQTKEKAQAQLRAIEASKASRAKASEVKVRKKK